MKSTPLFLFLLFASPAGAELYQWKDENGRVHFSDKKPGSTSAVTTLQAPSPQKRSNPEAVSPDGNSERSRMERQQRFLQVLKQDADEKEQSRLKQQSEKRQRDAECEKLRNHQRSIEGRRVWRTGADDENGAHAYLSDAERHEYDQQVAATIAEQCP